jgi:hypothetical protein
LAVIGRVDPSAGERRDGSIRSYAAHASIAKVGYIEVSNPIGADPIGCVQECRRSGNTIAAKSADPRSGNRSNHAPWRDPPNSILGSIRNIQIAARIHRDALRLDQECICGQSAIAHETSTRDGGDRKCIRTPGRIPSDQKG